MGSPEFALPSLRALDEVYEVVAVVCQPDRPAGRGRLPKASATKSYAEEAGISIYQPSRLRDEEAIGQIEGYLPGLIVVAAYGQILPQRVLDLPEHGSLNVHASLLPRWRGAAPVQAAILHGDKETGITIMKMDAGLDTGPIVRQRAIPLSRNETGGSLTEKLSLLGAKLLIEILPAHLAGELKPRAQDDTLATHAPMLKKSDGALDLQGTAQQLARQVRAFNPWPGTFIMWGDRRLAIKRVSVGPANSAATGMVSMIDKTPAITTLEGTLILEQVQPSGGREMSGEAFVRGAPEFVGSTLLT